MAKNRNYLKFLLILVIVGVITILFHYDLVGILSIDFLKSKHELLTQIVGTNFWRSSVVYFLIYVVVTALSLPGAAVMTLAGGALFGFYWGTILVSFASSIGASFSFLASRFLLRGMVEKRFATALSTINEGLKKEGGYYLLSLRLLPVVPFFVINAVMGLTSMALSRFYVISQIGMLAGTMVYVNAGTQLASVKTLRDVVSPTIFASFLLMGIFPIVVKKYLDALRKRKAFRGYVRPKSCDYNLVVIGAGAGGLVASYIAAAVKAKVALIERHKMGGDCLNTGCVPSKAFIKSANLASISRQATELGIASVSVEFDFAAIMERVQRAIDMIEPHDSRERYEALGVDCISGQARILSPFEVEVEGRILTTRNVIIATGGRPIIPDIPGIEQIPYRTSDTLWEIRERPRRLLILGGGPIGVEMAQSFQRLGSLVTIVEKASSILTREDEDISRIIKERLVKEGVKILCGHTAMRFEAKIKDQVLYCDYQGTNVEVEFDLCLLALGRKAVVDGFGGRELGLELNCNGQIESDPYLATNIPNIFVCGDVTGTYQFTHVAAHEAWYASVNALFGFIKKFKADYRVIPMVTYTDPELARVGVNESEARARNIPYEVVKYGIEDLDRAIVDGKSYGTIKVLTVPGSDKILGVSIVCENAGEILAEYVLAMKHKLGLNKILGTIHAYPTYAEANKYVAGEWKKKHTSPKILATLAWLHKTRRT